MLIDLERREAEKIKFESQLEFQVSQRPPHWTTQSPTVWGTTCF